MLISFGRSLLFTSVAAMSISLHADPSWATPAPAPFGIDVPAPTSAMAQAPFGMGRSSMLKHLPAGSVDLMFRGENAERSFSIILSRAEVEQTRTFQIAVRNAVAALPERSALDVIVNGQVLATIPARSPNAPLVVPVSIPRGTLVPGVNTVELADVMAHRVDCSIAATYELWTQVDPNLTGFVVPDPDFGPMRSIEEVAGEPLSADGTTRLFVSLANAPDALSIGRAALFINALVRRTGLVRPVVEAGPGRGKGAGIDLVIATGSDRDAALAGLSVVGREGAITFARDTGTGRLTLVVSAATDMDLDSELAAFADEATMFSPRGRQAIVGFDGERRTFADLGFQSMPFAGRRYSSSLAVTLPADFYPTSHDKARLLIDATFASTIDPDSQMVFRVNGSLVSSLGLGPDRGGVLHRELAELPLHFFHPGRNEIAIEAVTSTAADRKCRTAGTQSGPLFSLSDSSELEIPHLTRLGTSPQIPGALSELAGSSHRSTPLYLADFDPPTIGSALTVLASMGAEGESVASPLVRLGAPAPSDAPGLVVAPWAELPETLSTRLGDRIAKTDAPVVSNRPERTAAPRPENGVSEMATDLGPYAVRIERALDRSLASVDRFLGRNGIPIAQGRAAFDGAIGGAARLLEREGFFFGAGNATKAVLFSSHSLLVAAVDTQVDEGMVSRFNIPRFAFEPRQWLVLTASDADVLQTGLERMVSDGRWNELQGQAVSLDTDRGIVAATQPKRVLYLVPQAFALSDIRPILGGIVSDNIALSLGILVLLMSLLGVSTHALIRRSGAK